MDEDIRDITEALLAFDRIGSTHGYPHTAKNALEAWERVKEKIKVLPEPQRCTPNDRALREYKSAHKELIGHEPSDCFIEDDLIHIGLGGLIKGYTADEVHTLIRMMKG